jgi:hypothetical protein
MSGLLADKPSRAKFRAGLLTDRVEISNADPFANAETPEECATILGA